MLSSSNPSTGLCSKDQGPCNTLDQPLEPHPWRRRPSSDAVAAGHCPGTGPRRHHACQQDLRLSPAAILRLHQVLVRTIMDPQSERRHRCVLSHQSPTKGGVKTQPTMATQAGNRVPSQNPRSLVNGQWLSIALFGGSVLLLYTKGQCSASKNPSALEETIVQVPRPTYRWPTAFSLLRQRRRQMP